MQMALMSPAWVHGCPHVADLSLKAATSPSSSCHPTDVGSNGCLKTLPMGECDRLPRSLEQARYGSVIGKNLFSLEDLIGRSVFSQRGGHHACGSFCGENRSRFAHASWRETACRGLADVWPELKAHLQQPGLRYQSFQRSKSSVGMDFSDGGCGQRFADRRRGSRLCWLLGWLFLCA